MKLNHLDLQVSDVQRSVVFFERAGGLELQSSRTSPALAILADQHGFVLVLQRKKDDAERYPEGFHLGFLVDDVETVHRAHARAIEDGLEVSDVIENNRGVMIYLKAPDGYAVEVSCRRVKGP
jgi:catechol 2,3-dioxygenase-like lactoylglutathione lyase family enzyme